jgi:hypothetical protein
MRVLIDTSRGTFHDIVADGADFPVSPPLRWRNAPPGLSREWAFNGDTFVPPAGLSINELKREVLDGITEAREEALRNLTVRVNGANYDADEESHARIERAISAWERAVKNGDPRAPQSVQWLDADNISRTLTLEKLMEISAAIWLEQEASVWTRNNTLKARIKNATAEAAIRAVRWDDG